MTNPNDNMDEMTNDVTQVTPAQGLAVLCEKYGLVPEVVILFCWQSLVFDFLMRGKLDDEIANKIRSLQEECEVVEEEPEAPKIITATR